MVGFTDNANAPRSVTDCYERVTNTDAICTYHMKREAGSPRPLFISYVCTVHITKEVDSAPCDMYHMYQNLSDLYLFILKSISYIHMYCTSTYMLYES